MHWTILFVFIAFSNLMPVDANQSIKKVNKVKESYDGREISYIFPYHGSIIVRPASIFHVEIFCPSSYIPNENKFCVREECEDRYSLVTNNLCIKTKLIQCLPGFVKNHYGDCRKHFKING